MMEERERQRLEEKRRKKYVLNVECMCMCVLFFFRLEYWKRNAYVSCSVSLDSSGSSEEEEEEEEESVMTDIQYVVGDVTHPQNTGAADAVVVHCVGRFEARSIVGGCIPAMVCANRRPLCQLNVSFVDTSGRWGKGGLFSAISSRSQQPQAYYEDAGRMRDLELGDTHIVPLDDLISRTDGKDLVSLIVLGFFVGGLYQGILSVILVVICCT